MAAGLSISPSSWPQADYISKLRFVPHTSTVPANQGERVSISLHERLTSQTNDVINSGGRPRGIVLFVHGGTYSSIPDFDLPFKDYSWMHYLAEAGFDVFAMDHTGYGLSPRPEMDNPCNMPEESQSLLVPHVLSETCAPSYSQTLTALETDVDEVASVVSFILRLRDVERIHLIGWSAGGRRIAAYAATFPDTVDRLFLYAPSVYTEDGAPSILLQPPSVPMRLQTRERTMRGWESGITCDGSIDPGIQDVVWETIIGFDPLALVWRPTGDAIRARNAAPLVWNTDYSLRLVTPALMVVGEQDSLLPYVRDMYDVAPAAEKMLVNMECATHFAVWETTQHRFLHEASEDWLTSGQLQGERTGVFRVHANGALVAEGEVSE